MTKVVMNHDGMTRDAMKEAVKGRLSEGILYVMNLSRNNEEDGRKRARVRYKLISFSRNAVVFERSSGKVETFTYQELWGMLMTGAIG